MRERIAALIVLAPMVLGTIALLAVGRTAVPGPGDGGMVVFNLTGVAASGVWTLGEVNGLNYWWKRFQPATLYVTEGDEVVINLRSADLFHCFYIPAFAAGPVDVEPGHVESVRFIASRAGVYQYYCTSMCGGCHFYMRGWLVVTAVGETPVEPQPLVCGLCLPDAGTRPDGGDLVELGAYLYREKGCVTCHGVEGHGGVRNENSANHVVPAHDTTAEKLFLRSEEDAAALIELVTAHQDLDALEEEPEIQGFPIVRVRFENAKEIVRKGRYTGKQEPTGPEPPLQMPAWHYLVDEREIDALLAYFVSLYPWEEA